MMRRVCEQLWSPRLVSTTRFGHLLALLAASPLACQDEVVVREEHPPRTGTHTSTATATATRTSTSTDTAVFEECWSGGNCLRCCSTNFTAARDLWRDYWAEACMCGVSAPCEVECKPFCEGKADTPECAACTIEIQPCYQQAENRCRGREECAGIWLCWDGCEPP